MSFLVLPRVSENITNTKFDTLCVPKSTKITIVFHHIYQFSNLKNGFVRPHSFKSPQVVCGGSPALYSIASPCIGHIGFLFLCQAEVEQQLFRFCHSGPKSEIGTGGTWQINLCIISVFFNKLFAKTFHIF